jgi:transposase-like protein
MSVLLSVDARELEGVGADPRLIELVRGHGEDGFRLYLEEIRWPDGARCPRCDSHRLLWLERRTKYHCYDCRYQFRVTAGTLLHDSHVPMWKWLLAVSLMLSTADGLPATQLHRIIGGSYKTAWFIEHRIRAAMGQQTGSIGPLVAYADERLVHLDADPLVADRTIVHAETPPSLHLLQRILAGPYRNLGVKYLAAYWSELRWRETRLASPTVFRDTIAALLEHAPITYSALTSGAPARPLRATPHGR